MVAQQDRPLLRRPPDAVDLVGASVDDPRPLRCPAECIGSRVQRVVQDLHDGMIDRRLPDDLVDVDVPPDDGHFDLRRPEPEEDLPCAAEFAELREHHADGFLHMLVGIDLDLPASLQQNPGGSMNRNSPRRAFEIASRQAALPHQTEFIFGHRSFQGRKADGR